MSGSPWRDEAGLAARVECGTLVVTLTGGAIRAHTTLLTKQLQIGFGVHVGFNELVADPTINGRRLVGALGVLSRAVEEAESLARRAGVDLGRDPLHAVVKVQPYHVTPDERGALFRLARNNVFSIRDPVRTMESILKGMLEITHLRAVLGEIPFPRLDAVTVPGADLAHVRGPGWTPGAVPVVEVDLGDAPRRIELEPFGQHVRHMIERRDYSSLSEGFLRYFSYYPVLDGPDLKSACWRTVRRQLGEEEARRAAVAAGFDGWDAMVAALTDVPSTDFDRLPSPLAAPLRFRRTGWLALAEALAVADAAEEDYIVLDSLDLLAQPRTVLDELARRFGLPARTSVPPIPYAHFHPGFTGLPIQAALFRRVTTEDRIGPPGRSRPLPAERLPVFAHAEIETYYQTYVPALAGSRRLRVADGAEAFRTIEPTGVYARMVAGDHAAGGGRDAIRRDHPELERWFEAIDAAV